MSAVAEIETWLEANQRYLCAEFARIRALVEGAVIPGSIRQLEESIAEARANMHQESALDVLVDGFRLSSFERDVVLLAAAAEMDLATARVCAERNGLVDGAPTFAFALDVLPDAHWSAMAPSGPLRTWRLVERLPGPLLGSGVRVDERIMHFLAGVNTIDSRLRPLIKPLVPGALVAESHRVAARSIAMMTEQMDGSTLIQLTGDDPDGQHDCAAIAASLLGRGCYVLRAEELPIAPSERDAVSGLWAREAVLLGATLVIDAHTLTTLPAVDDLLASIPRPVFLCTREALRIRAESVSVPVERPHAAERKRLWREALGPCLDVLRPQLDVISGQYALSAREIASAGAAARLAASESADGVIVAVRRACHARGQGLDDVAQRITPAASWDDLVLPERTREILREMADQVRMRTLVYDDWGFAARSARGLGITALFTGESGTGKTMAAEVLARELGLELHRIDLSTVVSKYIGETEKNLRRLFDAAEASGSVLLFDEADALFGKRSEVRDSHDRFANIEVSYLLQRMEAYVGLAVLTTNAKSSLDRAFTRRLRFVVHFPFPDLAQREHIWKRVFPSEAPLDSLDYAKLARLKVAGGAIRNIAINAAFDAARRAERVGMPHLLAAARREFEKSDKTLSDGEARGWT